MNVPRLLPLIGVAVAGVIAVNALAGARDLPQMLSTARAMAEGVAAPDKSSRTGKGAKGAKGDKTPADDSIAAASLPPGQSTASPIPAGVCAPNAAELAKSAGLSPAELQMLQNLQNRRGQIDQREKNLDTQVQLLTAAEGKLDAKLKAMSDLKGQIEALMGQADQKTQGEVDRLVVVYTKMKPQDAAAVMSQLDDKVRVPVAAAMKPAVLAAILSKMSPLEAKTLTELLAHRFAPVQQLADAARAPAAAQPSAAPPAKPAATSKVQAVADAEPDDANVDEAGPTKAKPVKIAKRAAPNKKKLVIRAPKPKPPSAKPSVDQAKASAAPRPLSEVKDQPAKPADPPAAASAAAAKAS